MVKEVGNNLADDEEGQTPLDDLDEVIEDLAFEVATRLDWVDLVRRDFPTLTAEQEQIVRDMGQAFAADQLLHREWDGPHPTTADRTWARDIVRRLAGRYGVELASDEIRLLEDWAAGRLRVEE